MDTVLGDVLDDILNMMLCCYYGCNPGKEACLTCSCGMAPAQVIQKMSKQRRDSVESYKAGGREDLVAKVNGGCRRGRGRGRSIRCAPG